jgi:hypothetical protein
MTSTLGHLLKHRHLRRFVVKLPDPLGHRFVQTLEGVVFGDAPVANVVKRRFFVGGDEGK